MLVSKSSIIIKIRYAFIGRILYYLYGKMKLVFFEAKKMGKNKLRINQVDNSLTCV